MTLSRTDLAARLQRLAGTLSELKVRVRMAVATETGKAVAEAVNDLVAAALGGRPIPAPAYRSGSSYRPGYARDDDRDDDRSEWADDSDDDRPHWAGRRDDETESRPRRSAPVPRWPAVLALTVAVVKGWASRRLSGWAAASIAFVAGAAALAGGPVVPAGLALAGAALDLFPPTPRLN